MLPNSVEQETELPSMVIPKVALLATTPSIPARTESSSWLAAYLELTKPRILILILLISIAGFCLATEGSVDRLQLLHMSIGIGLLAAGLGALNQFFEREIDAVMRRTERRPLPSGRITPAKALLFGILAAVGGIAYLALLVNPLSAILGIVTLAGYLFLYTPLKRISTLSTVVGALPGAMPPLIGWTAARGEITVEASILFLIMFLWQFPHFLAIAWMYREDYARAGICMLPIIESEGRVTGQQVVLYALALLPVSLLPSMIGLAGVNYFFGALILSLVYLYFSVRVAVVRSRLQAKRLLQASVLYLPLLFVLMLLDKLAK
ncbi:MAG: heme o synthase [Acidobacteriota bacterium]